MIVRGDSSVQYIDNWNVFREAEDQHRASDGLSQLPVLSDEK